MTSVVLELLKGVASLQFESTLLEACAVASTSDLDEGLWDQTVVQQHSQVQFAEPRGEAESREGLCRFLEAHPPSVTLTLGTLVCAAHLLEPAEWEALVALVRQPESCLYA